MIKIEALRCFATVADVGSLAEAGERLGRTPSAISMTLKQLEEQLGEPLFASERKSKLSALGQLTLDEARQLLDHYEKAVTAIESFAHARSGSVRVAVVPSVAETILPKVVQVFSRRHTEVRIDIRDMDSEAVMRAILQERVDLGIATGSNVGGEIECEPLFSDQFGIICRADHRLARASAPISWSKLENSPIIANRLCMRIDSPPFRAILKDSKLMVRNTTSLLALVRAGVGITVLPRLVATNAGEDLAFLPLNDEAARRRIDIVYRAHAQHSPAVSRFAETVREVSREVVAGT